MIDIHNHILPNVDDGAKNLEESLNMIELYIADGVTDIIVTPHYIIGSSFTNQRTLMAYNELSKAINDNGYNINLYIGNECYLDESFLEGVDDQWYSLNNSQYVLVEFYYRMPVDQILNLTYRLKLKGFIPIIAHAERFVQNLYPYEAIEELSNAGCYMQINASALTNKNKKQESKLVSKLFKNNLVSFVASDAHNSTVRVPNLKKAYNIVNKKYGQNIANNVFIKNQKSIIKNIIIE